MANYGGRGPSPKDLHEYMDKEYGRQRNQIWYGVKINYNRNDDNNNDDENDDYEHDEHDNDDDDDNDEHDDDNDDDDNDNDNDSYDFIR